MASSVLEAIGSPPSRLAVYAEELRSIAEPAGSDNPAPLIRAARDVYDDAQVEGLSAPDGWLLAATALSARLPSAEERALAAQLLAAVEPLLPLREPTADLDEWLQRFGHVKAFMLVEAPRQAPQDAGVLAEVRQRVTLLDQTRQDVRKRVRDGLSGEALLATLGDYRALLGPSLSIDDTLPSVLDSLGHAYIRANRPPTLRQRWFSPVRYWPIETLEPDVSERFGRELLDTAEALEKTPLPIIASLRVLLHRDGLQDTLAGKLIEALARMERYSGSRFEEVAKALDARLRART